LTRVILTTVGTSLKVNAEKSGRPQADLLRDEPTAACAEANVLARLLEPGDRVELLHSQTPEGESCAREIGRWIENQGRSVTTFAIAGLTYRAQDFHRGLRSLILCLSRRLRVIRLNGDEPILNALGGFKAEVAYATLVGALFGIPNHYIHQGFDELLTIHPLPVAWDFAAIDEYAAILNWLEDEPRTQAEARSRLLTLPGTLRDALTEPADDGCVYLSPLGIAYIEAYQNRIDTATAAVFLSSYAVKDRVDMEPSVRAMFDRVLKRLRVPEIRRSGSKMLERKDGDVLVFPRGHVDERVYWYEDDGAVRVVEMTRHETGYYDCPVLKQDYDDGEWVPWSE
jgi:putative CRISPR-associated protein (TIGR02619 family)